MSKLQRYIGETNLHKMSDEEILQHIVGLRIMSNDMGKNHDSYTFYQAILYCLMEGVPVYCQYINNDENVIYSFQQGIIDSVRKAIKKGFSFMDPTLTFDDLIKRNPEGDNDAIPNA